MDIAGGYGTLPYLLDELARRKTQVITLSEVSPSLEEVYLRIVEGNRQIDMNMEVV